VCWIRLAVFNAASGEKVDSDLVTFQPTKGVPIPAARGHTHVNGDTIAVCKKALV
jgi:hypothetical protein